MTQVALQPDVQAVLLSSERLTVEINPAGSLYRGARFDWHGFITQVTLDGAHTFCTSESLTPGKGTGGIGLCNEYGNEKPTGYADARPGETFPKLGIGLLRRPKDPDYSYMREHEIVQLFPVTCTSTPDQLSVVMEPVDCRGYAVRLVTNFKVKHNWLEINYRMENTGKRPVDTHEYRHNFIGIDGQFIGPDYHLHLPYPIEMEKIAHAYHKLAPPLLRKLLPNALMDAMIENMLQKGLRVVAIKGGDVDFLARPSTWFYFRTSGFDFRTDYQWEIMLCSKAVGVREYDDFTPSRVGVWGDAHVISAETFIDISLQPGEVKAWQRKYEFFG